MVACRFSARFWTAFLTLMRASTECASAANEPFVSLPSTLLGSVFDLQFSSSYALVVDYSPSSNQGRLLRRNMAAPNNVDAAQNNWHDSQLPLCEPFSTVWMTECGVSWVSVNKYFPYVVYAGSSSRSWYSVDGGATWNYGSLLRIENLQFHPTRPSWLLASEMLVFGPTKQERQLLVSFDHGRSWPHTRYRITNQYTFGNAGLNGEPETRIMVVDIDVKAGTATAPIYRSLISTTNFFISNTRLIGSCVSFMWTPQVIIALHARPTQDSQSYTLSFFASLDSGASFRSTYFPGGILTSPVVTETFDFEGSAVLQIVAASSKASTGDLYESNAGGTQFIKRLSDMVRYGDTVALWKGGASIPGILLSNVLRSKGAIQSKISVNSGADWYILSGDVHVAVGLQNNGHIEPRADPTAPGIIVATGNYGTSLNTSRAQLTLLSRDAGEHWITFSASPCHVAVGFHGSVAVAAASDVVPVWSLKWTTDFSERSNPDTRFGRISLPTLLIVEDIFAFPTLGSMLFLVTVQSNGTRRMFEIDLSPVALRRCEFNSGPGAPDSDYELYAPSSVYGVPAACFRGQRIAFPRRKASARCFDTRDFSIVNFTESCPCTLLDYTCDRGYERSLDNQCLLVDGSKPPRGYGFTCGPYESQGYVLPAGNMCNVTSGMDLTPHARSVDIPCSGGILVNDVGAGLDASDENLLLIITISTIAGSAVVLIVSLVLMCGGFAASLP